MKNTFFNKIIYFVFAIILFTSCKTSKPYTEEMKTELVSMFNTDQKIQDWDPKRSQEEKYRDSMKVEWNKIVRANCETIKKYYKDYGYPGIKENDRGTSIKFWLIVQHSDHDVAFQEKMLKSIKKELKKKNVEPRNYAYLYDRVATNKGDKQLYATQIDWTTGKPLPFPLKYPEKVEELRKEMGLEPLKEYLDSFLKK